MTALSLDDKAIRELSYMIRFRPSRDCLGKIDEIWAFYESIKAPSIYASTGILNVLVKSCDSLENLLSFYGGADALYSRLFEQKNENDALEYLKNVTQTVINLNKGIITDTKENSLRKVVHYMEAHFCDPDISFGSMARSVNFSISYISALLKKKLNTSFVKMLTELRMEKAKLLLTDPSLKIVDVAKQLGYNDSYYFSHCFKKYAGVSPRDYKNTYRV